MTSPGGALEEASSSGASEPGGVVDAAKRAVPAGDRCEASASNEPRAAARGSAANAGIAAALAALAFASYAPALAYGFVWDDVHVLVESERLHALSALLEVFRRPAMWASDLPLGPIGTYRPLALATFVIDHQIWGLRPFGFHLTSLLLHAAVVALTFLLFLRLVGRRAPAAGLAALVAVHPAAAEAVAWINGRSEPLALLFGLAATLVASGPRRTGRAPATAALLLLALLGKETGAIFLVAMPLLASALGGGSAGRLAWRGLDRSIAAAAGAALVAYVALRLQALGPAAAPARLALGATLEAVPALLMRAAQMAFVPLEPAPVTVGFWIRHLSLVERGLYVAATLLMLAALVALARFGRRAAAGGFAFWLASLLPVALVVTTSWPGLARWLYIGMPGLLFGLWASGIDRLRPRRQGALLVGALTAFSALTWRALPTWTNNERLYAGMIELSPEDPFGHQALGAELLQRRGCRSALPLFEKAVELGSRNAEVIRLIAACRARRGRSAAFGAPAPRV